MMPVTGMLQISRWLFVVWKGNMYFLVAYVLEVNMSYYYYPEYIYYGHIIPSRPNMGAFDANCRVY